VALVLETLGGDETLDARSLGVGLGTLSLGLDLTTNDELADLDHNYSQYWYSSQTQPAAAIRHGDGLAKRNRASWEVLTSSSLLRPKNLRIFVARLGPRRLGWTVSVRPGRSASPCFTSAARAVARVSVGEEEAHTGRVHDTLLHGETLLVVAAGDLEDVALELVANGVARDFLTHAAVHEDAELALILNIDELLRAIGGEGDVQLHLVDDGAGGRLIVEGRWS
jgi:hypothetical protein